ncbi:50S ribosomal protein L22 [Patescibacteria group bacterium]|nr:50S ribosomal protein L22 [Patescibacteria group bacterium]
MEVKASLKHLRTSPRKTRLVADMVRGEKVDKALNQLKLTNKKVTLPLYKLLMSAISNAENNFELEKDNLMIKEIRVDDGATLKRWMPRAHGRATPIRKRSSHVMLTLAEIVESKKDQDTKTKKKGILSKPKRVKSVDEKSEVKKGNKSEKVKDEKQPENTNTKQAKGKEFVDPARVASRGGHAKIEGGSGVQPKKSFRRKSG